MVSTTAVLPEPLVCAPSLCAVRNRPSANGRVLALALNSTVTTWPAALVGSSRWPKSKVMPLAVALTMAEPRTTPAGGLTSL